MLLIFPTYLSIVENTMPQTSSAQQGVRKEWIQVGQEAQSFCESETPSQARQHVMAQGFHCIVPEQFTINLLN